MEKLNLLYEIKKKLDSFYNLFYKVIKDISFKEEFDKIPQTSDRVI
jgi:hypothetical protein